jgi:hypothetical protein
LHQVRRLVNHLSDRPLNHEDGSDSPSLIGEVVLYRPLSFTWLTLVSLVFAAAIIAFLVLASYTRKEEKMVSDPNLLHMADPFCFDVDVRYQHLNK